MSAYSDRVREYFTAPAHAGDLAEGTTVLVDEQDVRLLLSARATGGVIDAMRFRAWGCPHTIASAEAACRALEGRPVRELIEFSASGLMEELAVPVVKTGRILVREDAVRSLGPLLDD
jgi:NifU-like protein involved in Fe-S cluster formation